MSVSPVRPHIGITWRALKSDSSWVPLPETLRSLIWAQPEHQDFLQPPASDCHVLGNHCCARANLETVCCRGRTLDTHYKGTEQAGLSQGTLSIWRTWEVGRATNQSFPIKTLRCLALPMSRDMNTSFELEIKT